MPRVLLVCPEPLGHRQPAGIGIRFLEMAKVLTADGHSVTLLSPDGGGTGVATAQLSAESLARESEGSDVAVIQGHAANEFFAHAHAIPAVIDLYDPYIVENLHYFRERGVEVFQHDHATLIRSLVRGDFFLCASEAQRLFYLGALLATGRVNPAAFQDDPRLESLIRIAPFGVQPPSSREPRAPAKPAVLFGGIYDWYDPLLAIDAIAIARESLPTISLTFNRHPNPGITPQGAAAAAMRYVTQKGYGSFVEFEPWNAYEERSAFFARFSLALLTFRDSIETDLSMRTRIYDYLWGGLPVVSSPAPGTDELLEFYGAGITVREQTAAAIAREILAVLRDGTLYERMSAGASHFVRDYQWPEVLEPLREFCRNPRVDPHKKSFAHELDVPVRKPTFVERLRRRLGGRS